MALSDEEVQQLVAQYKTRQDQEDKENIKDTPPPPPPLRSIQSCFGVNAGIDFMSVALETIKFKIVRVTIPWHICALPSGAYDFNWADGFMRQLDIAGADILVNCYATPQWLEPSWPAIPYWNPPYAIPIMRPEWVPLWKEFLQAFVDHFKPIVANVKLVFNISTEVNLTKMWMDPLNPGQRANIQDYIDLVVRPAHDILNPQGYVLVGPGITMRGENKITLKEAMEMMLYFRDNASKYYDILDAHVYRKTGEETISDMLKTYSTLYPENDKPLWVSETGFSDEDQDQLRNYIVLMDFLEGNKQAQNIVAACAYRLWGPDFSSRAALLNPDGSLRPSALEIQRRMSI